MAKKNIATFLGTQKGLIVVGSHAYAYSGTSNPGTGPTTYLEFATGKEYIVGKFEMNADFIGGGGNVLNVAIYLNGVRIIFEQDVSNNWLAGDNQYPVIIPPLTLVRADLGGDDDLMNINFVGRVYNV